MSCNHSSDCCRGSLVDSLELEIEKLEKKVDRLTVEKTQILNEINRELVELPPDTDLTILPNILIKQVLTRIIEKFPN